MTFTGHKYFVAIHLIRTQLLNMVQTYTNLLAHLFARAQASSSHFAN